VSFFSEDKIYVRKSQPQPSQVFVNVPLTNMSVAFVQSSDNFVARRIFPNVPTQLQGGTFWKYAKGTFTRDEMQARAPGAPAAMMGHKPTTDTFLTEFYSLGHPLPDQTMANNQNPLRTDRAAMKLITRGAEMRLERHFATNFLTTSVWTGTADKTGVAGTPGSNQFKQWNDTASTPIKDIAAFSTEMQTNSDGFRPKGLLLGRQVWDQLRNHPEILDRINRGQTTGPAQVTRQSVAALMELDEILVGDAVVNTALENATISNSFVIGKVALLYYVTDNPTIEEPSAGYTFTWEGMLGGGASALGTRIRRYRDEKILSDVMEIDAAFDMKAVCPEMGGFMTSVVA
jgi:hypothetical protein